jgi:hypothetical protein
VSSRLLTVLLKLAIAPALLLDAASNLALAQSRLDAAYTATLLGLPIGEIAWKVDLRDNRFAGTAVGSLAGLLRLFSDGHAEVAFHGGSLRHLAGELFLHTK